MWKPDEFKIVFNKNYQNTERALREDHLRGFREMEALKRTHEIYVAGVSSAQLDENQNTINKLMNKVQELQYDI